MDFKMIKYYDTCCDRCGNWATTDIGAGRMSVNKKQAEKILKQQGWKNIDGEVICGFCMNNETRRIPTPF